MRIPVTLLLAAVTLTAATPPASDIDFPLPSRVLLWPNGAPEAKGDTEFDKPDLTIYPINGPQKTPTGIIVFPGGGYVHLAVDHEGAQIAAWLNSYGITAFVLRYRLGPNYHHPVELHDAQRAIRWVRAHARDYGIEHIGVWGFSAGGHLASSVGTHFDSGNASAQDPIDHESSRPDFLILAYPVITFQEPYLHRGSTRVSARQESGSGTRPIFIKRVAGHEGHAADVSIPYLGRQRGTSAEQHHVLRCIAQGGSRCRNAHLRARSARRRIWRVTCQRCRRGRTC